MNFAIAPSIAIVAVVAILVFGTRSCTEETHRLRHEQRIACLNAGGLILEDRSSEDFDCIRVGVSQVQPIEITPE